MNRKKCSTIVAAAMAITLTLPCAVSAATHNLDPVADTYVSSQYPGINYGLEETLYVHRGDCTKRTYLKFDLTGLPGGETVTGATLFLFSDGGVQGLVLDAYHVTDDSWGEYSLNWNDQPWSTGGPAAIASAGTVHGWMSWTLPLATIDSDHDGLLSILIKLQAESGQGATATFFSREATYPNTDPPVSREELPYLCISTTPVPVPATVLLLGSGLVGLAAFRRRFRRS